jgi:hypothetical protein
MTELTRQGLLARIAEESDRDSGFRARLLADPRGVISELTAVQIPETVNITVHEESPTDIHLVLENDVAELSEEDLQLVSGGWGDACFIAQ